MSYPSNEWIDAVNDALNVEFTFSNGLSARARPKDGSSNDADLTVDGNWPARVVVVGDTNVLPHVTYTTLTVLVQEVEDQHKVKVQAYTGNGKWAPGHMVFNGVHDSTPTLVLTMRLGDLHVWLDAFNAISRD